MRWTTAAAATLVTGLLAVTGGCGAGEEAENAPSSGFLTPADTSAAPAPEAATLTPEAAMSVRVVVSGGISGAIDVHEVRRGEPADGLTPPQVERVLALAADDAVRALDGKHRAGPQPCCDVQQIDLTVLHADGTRTRVRVPQTEPMPPALRRLVTLVSRAR